MDATPGRSLTGAARRSRRLQGTPAGHTGGATTATGSPYARPALKRDSSSQTLATLESGGKANGSHGDGVKLDRRKSVAGTDGIFGRVKRGLGWLVGRSAENSASTMDQADEKAGDEESMLSGSTRLRNREPPVATPRASSTLSRNPPLLSSTRDANPSPSLFSHDGGFEDQETSAAKKLRTSHSTLNLPTRKASPPKPNRVAHSSTGALAERRAVSPIGQLSPRARMLESQDSVSIRNKAHIFAPTTSARTSLHTLNGATATSRRSVSPGGMSQFALGSQPASGASSAFGLQSQSPFRAGGHTARSPDLAALNISSGLARSPSLPPDRLLALQRQGSRLYPYQRSPSTLSGLARPNTIVPSYSVGSTLNGLKRDHGAMSMSPPKHSPGSLPYFRTASQGLNISPTSTDFSTDFSHRNKRQRVSVAWHPEEGFISTDAEGNPLRNDVAPVAVPKNEAERILERLENIRRPQINGLRSSSPRRLNVPLPTSSTPGRESIFATRISSSRTEPALSGYAISPYSRRQQAYREERALRRDKINARGGLSEHLRAAYAHRQSPPSQGADDVADSDDMDAPPAQDEDVSNAGEQEEEDLLPKPIARGTRQRTRELSVMSDASVVMDDTMASPRRSARIKNKPADDASPVRERKSAKSPPPTTGKRGKRKEAVSELTSDTEMQAGRSSRATSPRRARSPQKSSTINGRAASPAADDQNMTIDQIISPAQPAETPAKEQPGQRGLSAREQRLQSTVGRKSRGFSAKDEGDDIPASSAGVLDQPKLKLPNSVFANRFSFGRSPSSSLLASPVPGTARTEAMSTGAPNVHSGSASDAQSAVLPKLALPSSVSSSSGNANPSTAEHAGKPLNSPKPPSTSPSTSAQIAPAGGSSDAPQTTLPPNKPLFSFTAPSRDPMESSQTPAQQNQAQQQTVQSGNVPTFSFGKASQTKPVNDEAAPASTTPAPFSFGQASNKRKPEEKSSSFTVGKTADATSSPVIPVIDVTKPSNPFAAFPAPISSTPTASEQETSSTNTGKPAFSFGQKTNAPAVSSGEKGEGASTPAASTITTTPAFTFGAASSPAPVVVGDNTKAPDAQGMQASPPPAIDNDKPANAPFSPVVQPSKPPAFSFGPPASSSSTGPATATQTPAFTFGTQAANQGETKSRSASPFSVGAPAQPFTFGASDAAKPATPAFSFGAPKPESKANDKPTSSTGFTFGSGTPAASAASTPAFSFGAPKPASSNPFAAAPNMQASGSAFGATTPAVANSTQSAPAFGQSTTNGSAPTFAFGAPSNAATNNSTPSFTFGAASTPAASNPPAFSFGAANAATTSQPFVFGGGSATGAPTPPASSAAAVPSFNFSAASAPGSQPVSPALTPSGLEQSGGSFFTIGAGDTPSSPNKPRRPVKPLRRPR